MSRIAQLILIATLLGLLSLLPQHSVFAAPPTHEFGVDETFTVTIPGDVSGCGFDITATQTGTGTVTTFYDQDANVTRVRLASPPSGLSVTFSANGHTYTGISSGNIWTFYVAGSPTRFTINGLEQHLVLPGMGVVGQVTGHFTMDLTTGQVTMNGPDTMSLSAPWSPEACAAFAP